MAENPSITVGGEAGGRGDTYNCASEVIGLELDILGKEVDFRVVVGQGQARLADIVPLSVPEALRLNEEISAAPPHQRESMLKACLLAARRILSQKPPKQFIDKTTDTYQVSPAELNLVSSWYTSLKLPCPFLYKGLCTIYEQRPLACREHFVKGSADGCRGRPGTAEVVEMPVQLPNARAQLAGELEGTSAEALILPLALVWCEENSKRAERTWPAAMMVKRFFEIVKTMAPRDSIAIVEYKERRLPVSQKRIGQRQRFDYIGSH